MTQTACGTASPLHVAFFVHTLDSVEHLHVKFGFAIGQIMSVV